MVHDGAGKNVRQEWCLQGNVQAFTPSLAHGNDRRGKRQPASRNGGIRSHLGGGLDVPKLKSDIRMNGVSVLSTQKTMSYMHCELSVDRLEI